MKYPAVQKPSAPLARRIREWHSSNLDQRGVPSSRNAHFAPTVVSSRSGYGLSVPGGRTVADGTAEIPTFIPTTGRHKASRAGLLFQLRGTKQHQLDGCEGPPDLRRHQPDRTHRDRSGSQQLGNQCAANDGASALAIGRTRGVQRRSTPAKLDGEPSEPTRLLTPRPHVRTIVRT